MKESVVDIHDLQEAAPFFKSRFGSFLGKVLIKWLRPFTITLKSGRREANISINIIPSIDPIGWFETVAKAPSGR